jgi:hypothetical protein
MVFRYLKTIAILLICALILALGVYLGVTWKSNFSTRTSANASVVVERIKEIHEMAFVEAHLSEIYDYKDYWGFDLSPFRKKAIILVEGHVKAGVDLQSIDLQWDEESKTLTIDSLPPCTILSIDHDLRYYDIQEGSFNTFDASKLSDLQKGAKDFLASKAIDRRVLARAEERKELFLEEAREALSAMGWTLVINDKDPLVKG